MAMKDNQAIREKFASLVSEANTIEPELPLKNHLPWAPFPINVLPGVLARFVDETSASIGCDPTMVALPVLATTAAAIGGSRSILLKEGWTEPSIIWTAVVARSGTQKSPAFSAATKPLVTIQEEAFELFDKAKADFDCDIALYEAQPKAKRESQRKPVTPIPSRYILGDCTTEALAPILRDNPRGVLMARDELSGWWRSFNQYKGGKGSDEAFWLEAFHARGFTFDRKTGDNNLIRIPRAIVTVCGTIQPGVFDALMTPERLESGMSARILLAHPPDRRKQWSSKFTSKKTDNNYKQLIRELVKLSPSGEEVFNPRFLPLTKEAGRLWGNWYNRHANLQYNSVEDVEAATLAKLEAYTARFALVLTLAENPKATNIDTTAIERAIGLSDWFVHESKRLYFRSKESEEEREHRKIVEIINRNRGEITPRELHRRCRAYRSTADAEAVLNSLVKAGRLKCEVPKPGLQGGRPSIIYTLVDADKTQCKQPKNGGFVDASEDSVE